MFVFGMVEDTTAPTTARNPGCRRQCRLVLYCPAFDDIEIWFVKTDDFLQRTQSVRPSTTRTNQRG